MGRAKRICYLSPMRAAKVQASLRIRAVSPEPSLLAHTSSEWRGTFRQKAKSLAPLNGWACAVKICHDGMLEDTNSLDGAQMKNGLVEMLMRMEYSIRHKRVKDRSDKFILPPLHARPYHEKVKQMRATRTDNRPTWQDKSRKGFYRFQNCKKYSVFDLIVVTAKHNATKDRNIMTDHVNVHVDFL